MLTAIKIWNTAREVNLKLAKFIILVILIKKLKFVILRLWIRMNIRFIILNKIVVNWQFYIFTKMLPCRLNGHSILSLSLNTCMSSLVTFSQKSKISFPPATEALHSVIRHIVRSFLASERKQYSSIFSIINVSFKFRQLGNGKTFFMAIYN